MKCIICESKDFYDYLINSEAILEKCAKCGLVRTKNFKKPNYANYHRDHEYASNEMLFKRIFNTRYKLIREYKSRGSVLDIGSANGVLLDIFKENGFETFGVEPSGSYLLAVSKGHTIYHSTLEKSKIRRKFDVIVANHVLEHIVNADSFLISCKQLLKNTGVLYVDVPNFGSLSASISKNSWKYILAKEHVYHFTSETLSKLLEKSGFKVVKIYTRSGIFEADNPLAYLIDELTLRRKNFFSDLVGIPGNILSGWLNKGTSMGIIACEK